MQQVSFNFKGRYAILGNLDESTKRLLYVFHGQGQLANYFIQKFKCLQNEGYTIIAPEGLHHYYLNGFTGRVGASWMTSENREESIENYLTYLGALHQQVMEQITANPKIHLLGFSQGTATISRWVEQSSFDFEELILWGGALPPDLSPSLISQRLNEKRLVQVIGKKDPYIDPQKLAEVKMLIERYKILAEYQFYNGGHDIIEKELLAIFSSPS